MHTTNYTNTLILVSPDCPSAGARVPDRPGTIAALQYERLSAAPYQLTSDDLLSGIHAERFGVPVEDRAEARAAFFSKGQACLRSSPLVKIHGWGIHHDGQSRVALVDSRSPRYAELIGDDSVIKVNGMRSKRAR